MAIMWLASEVYAILGALYGPPEWTHTLNKCGDILTVREVLFPEDVRGRLAALEMAGHNPAALMAVGLAFGIVPKAQYTERRIAYIDCPVNLIGEGG